MADLYLNQSIYIHIPIGVCKKKEMVLLFSIALHWPGRTCFRGGASPFEGFLGLTAVRRGRNTELKRSNFRLLAIMWKGMRRRSQSEVFYFYFIFFCCKPTIDKRLGVCSTIFIKEKWILTLIFWRACFVVCFLIGKLMMSDQNFICLLKRAIPYYHR
jgi:hypothetical protein